MACSCGGSSLASGSAKVKTEPAAYVMHFGACKTCGRVGMESLYQDGERILTGPRARKAYQSLVECGSFPPSLLEPECAPVDANPGKEDSSLAPKETMHEQGVAELSDQMSLF